MNVAKKGLLIVIALLLTVAGAGYFGFVRPKEQAYVEALKQELQSVFPGYTVDSISMSMLSGSLDVKGFKGNVFEDGDTMSFEAMSVQMPYRVLFGMADSGEQVICNQFSLQNFSLESEEVGVTKWGRLEVNNLRLDMDALKNSNDNLSAYTLIQVGNLSLDDYTQTQAVFPFPITQQVKELKMENFSLLQGGTILFKDFTVLLGDGEFLSLKIAEGGVKAYSLPGSLAEAVVEDDLGASLLNKDYEDLQERLLGAVVGKGFTLHGLWLKDLNMKAGMFNREPVTLQDLYLDVASTDETSGNLELRFADYVWPASYASMLFESTFPRNNMPVTLSGNVRMRWDMERDTYIVAIEDLLLREPHTATFAMKGKFLIPYDPDLQDIVPEAGTIASIAATVEDKGIRNSFASHIGARSGQSVEQAFQSLSQQCEKSVGENARGLCLFIEQGGKLEGNFEGPEPVPFNQLSESIFLQHIPVQNSTQQ